MPSPIVRLLADPVVIEGNPVNFLDVLKDPSLLEKWKALIKQKNHPDNFPEDKKRRARGLLEQLDEYIGLIQIVELKELTVSHLYSATKTIGNYDYTKPETVPFTLQAPVLAPQIKTFIHQYYGLTAEEIAQIDKEYDAIILQLAKELLQNHQRDLLTFFYCSSEALKKEVATLTNDNSLAQLLNQLQNSSVFFDTFDENIQAHADTFCQLATALLSHPEFRRKLPSVYANLALNKKVPQDNAYRIIAASILRNMIRLIPTALIFSSIVGGVGMLFYPFFMMLGWLDQVTIVLTTLDIIMTTLSIMGWAVLIQPQFATDIVNFVENKILGPLSNSIDTMIEILFSTKLYTLEISKFLSTKTEKQADNAFGFFKVGAPVEAAEEKSEDDETDATLLKQLEMMD